MKEMENDGFEAMVVTESFLQLSGRRWNETKGGEGENTGFLLDFLPEGVGPMHTHLDYQHVQGMI